jgi:hypothetical protein
MGKATRKQNNIVCKICKSAVHNGRLTEIGSNIGNSQVLARAIMVKHYGGVPSRQHPLSRPKRKGSCAQAHHLICSESMDTKKWSDICKSFGYNINCIENGIMLPADMRVACQEEVPLHRGNHSETVTTMESKTYVDAVKSKVRDIEQAAKQHGCNNPKSILDELKALSKEIWSYLKGFDWTITSDGFDYDPDASQGCLNQKTLTKKRAVNRSKVFYCAETRNHGFNIKKGSYFREQK